MADDSMLSVESDSAFSDFSDVDPNFEPGDLSNSDIENEKESRPPKCRKRVRQENKQKKNIRKYNRERGMEYQSTRGKKVKKKVFVNKKCLCPHTIQISDGKITSALKLRSSDDTPLEDRRDDKLRQLKKSRKRDIEGSLREGLTKIFVFDLQKTLPTPVLSTGVAYYKWQLWTYNLCVHDEIAKTGFMYIWNETIAARGA
ncbi:hypothetical protein ILUMI_17745 [Ignelater luminosus]|uniref:Uncharacterized protein n=1 Tax=Ignelater luminosus TaxID=2038154 RepID=A0A8K0CJB6_IGNLU|nr:hypothetical protein ILUMI_17745 [Ignelater luminosus]